ncbi:MAG: hypothetical protein CMJ48_11640 [Planctomycetaceae bacterium]|nr:hypothetical protein [Planctomycetaceae bacterium]
MPNTELKNGLDDNQVIDLFLEKKVVSEAQLKAALDFQKSTGGSVVDVLLKLGLIRSADIDEVLRDSEEASEERQEDTKESNVVLDPATIDENDLKIHHRLLDKLPSAVVDDSLILLFFPVSQICTRKLIVGHGRAIDDELLNKMRGLLGVEICSLSLSEASACEFLNQYDERSGGGKPKRVPSQASDSPAEPDDDTFNAADMQAAALSSKAPSSKAPSSKAPPSKAPPSKAPPSKAPSPETSSAKRDGGEARGDDQALLKALIGLLIKKDVMTKAELQVEFELLRGK